MVGGTVSGSENWKARVGEFAVYPGHGVARIAELRVQEIAGQKAEFLVLQLVDGDSRILIPCEQLDNVGLRRIMGSEDADKIWVILRKRTRRRSSHGVTWSRQFREYQEKLREGTVFQVAEVLRDLLRLQTHKELSFGEHRLLENARTLIVQELAASQAVEADAIEREIKAAVS
jgi:CarD family transcriptional regulator